MTANSQSWQGRVDHGPIPGTSSARVKRTSPLASIKLEFDGARYSRRIVKTCARSILRPVLWWTLRKRRRRRAGRWLTAMDTTERLPRRGRVVHVARSRPPACKPDALPSRFCAAPPPCCRGQCSPSSRPRSFAASIAPIRCYSVISRGSNRPSSISCPSTCRIALHCGPAFRHARQRRDMV